MYHSAHTHIHKDKNSLLLVITAIIAVLLFFYYGLKFADVSYSRVLGVNNINEIESASNKPQIYLFFTLLLLCFTFLTFYAYRIFVKQYNTIANPTIKVGKNKTKSKLYSASKSKKSRKS